MSFADEKAYYRMTRAVFKQNIQWTEQIVDKVVTHCNNLGYGTDLRANFLS